MQNILHTPYTEDQAQPKAIGSLDFKSDGNFYSESFAVGSLDFLKTQELLQSTN